MSTQSTISSSPIDSKMQVVPNVDPFITKVFMGVSISPKAIPTDISWDEKQEQARVARERKRYVRIYEWIYSNIIAIKVPNLG